VIALLFVAGPVDPALFAEADAVIDCFYSAEATGLAIQDIVFGAVSPAGRLPFSWPTLPTDVPPE
jgi:beta-glucosidase